MLDINLLRKDLDSAMARLETRKSPQTFLNVEGFKTLEAERKTIQMRTEELQSRRNSSSKRYGQLMGLIKKGGPGAEEANIEAAASLLESNGLKAELESSGTRLDQIQADMQVLLLAVPNLPHASVPVGADEHGNVVVRSWGEPKVYDFDVKDHVDLGTPLGLDFEIDRKSTRLNSSHS